MKRRKFLGMFGGAVAAPLLPMPAIAATATKAAYSPAALHAAIYHAQSRAVFSVWGLAKTLNVPVTIAEALMGDLAKRGVLGPLQGTTFGGRWARSNVLQSEALGLTRARTKNQRISAPQNVQALQPDLTTMLQHLRQMADTYFAHQKAVA